MNPLNLASHPSTWHMGAHVARRTQRHWLKRVGAALWSALQEARQARPERELLELIERPSATRVTGADRAR